MASPPTNLTINVPRLGVTGNGACNYPSKQHDCNHNATPRLAAEQGR
jgi:hypothetical protein